MICLATGLLYVSKSEFEEPAVSKSAQKDLRLVLVQNFMFWYGWALGRMLLVFGCEFLINENTGTFFLKYNKRKDEARQTDGHIALSECGPKNHTQTATEHLGIMARNQPVKCSSTEGKIA